MRDQGSPRVIVVATRSEGKLRELVPLLAAAGYAARSLDDAGIAADPAEDAIEAFDSFEENARAKARWYSARANGAAVLAEDSGLEVAALQNRPGVRSKRWALDERATPETRALTGAALDAANNAALLHALHEVNGAHERRARYVCVAVLIDGAREWVTRGETRGTVARAPSGDGGFGYDPYFVSDELGASFAVASREAKAAVSHRGRAVRAVLAAYAKSPSSGDG